MSISPFDSLDSKPASNALRSSQGSGPKGPMAADSLSLSQALIITAGMAGLIGLFSGVIIRFSLANSPNARFLSPLQTFPALSNWTPEPSQVGEANGNAVGDDSARDQPAEAIRTFESSEPPDYLQEELAEPTDGSFNPANDIDSVDATTFDSFAKRDTPSRRSASGRWDALESGPKFRQDAEDKLRPYDASELDSLESDRSIDVNSDVSSSTRSTDENSSEFGYGEDAYREDDFSLADDYSEYNYSEDIYPASGDESAVYSDEDDVYDDYPEND